MPAPNEFETGIRGIVGVYEMTKSEKLEHYHKEGQKDYKDRDYNPPNAGPPVIYDLCESREQAKENAAYNAGYANARKQDK